MAQKLYTGTAGADLLDATALGLHDFAVFRGGGGADTMIGSSGNDRFAGLGTGAAMFGGAGNDSFFETFNANPPGGLDTIDGGTGRDEFIFAVFSNQITTALRAEIARLDGYLVDQVNAPSVHFVSQLLHVDLVNVEAARIRVDGVLKSLDSLIAQTVVTGTPGNDMIDASTHTDSVVLRAGAGADTVLGGSGNDRIDGGPGADFLSGGAGNDSFFETFDPQAADGRDTIDGGTGTDQLFLTLGTYQLTPAVVAELHRLEDFTILHGSDGTAHFTSDLLHLDMTNVEVARLRLDGAITTIEAVTPRIANGSFERAPDFTGWHVHAQSDASYVASSYDAHVDRSGAAFATNGIAAAVLGFQGGIAAHAGTATALGPVLTSDAFAARLGEHVSFDWTLSGVLAGGELKAVLLDGVTAAVVQTLFDTSAAVGVSTHGAAVGAAIGATGSYTLAFELISATGDTHLGAAATLDHVVIA